MKSKPISRKEVSLLYQEIREEAEQRRADAALQEAKALGLDEASYLSDADIAALNCGK